jgi:hypothetical protein
MLPFFMKVELMPVDFLMPHASSSYTVKDGNGLNPRYTADANEIVYDVAEQHVGQMVLLGGIPRLPVGWTDPRPVKSKN